MFTCAHTPVSLYGSVCFAKLNIKGLTLQGKEINHRFSVCKQFRQISCCIQDQSMTCYFETVRTYLHVKVKLFNHLQHFRTPHDQ